MISPEEVEQVLRSHPELDDAAVIGVQDVEWGEEVRAIVVGYADRVTEEQIIEFCWEKLAGFKRPRSVVFVEELPRNVMGKVLKAGPARGIRLSGGKSGLIPHRKQLLGTTIAGA